MFGIFFILVSLIFTLVANVAVIAETGRGRASFFCNFIIYLAFWPSFLLHVDSDKLFISYNTFLINAVGWGMTGIFIGTLFYYVRKTKKHRLDLEG